MRIAPIHFKVLAYTLDIEGFNAKRVLNQCGIDALKEDGEWLPVALFDRLMVGAIEATRNESFGLVAGRSIALTRFGVITSLLLTAPNLRQMLEDLRRFASLVLERWEITVDERSRATRLLVEPIVRDGLGGRFRMEQVTVGALQMLRVAGATNDDVLQVNFPYPTPAGHEAAYASAFGPRVAFGQADCSITFNTRLMDGQLPNHDPMAYLAARTRLDAMLAAMTARSDLSDQVRRWLLSALPHQPTAAETAAHLGMSERSLRRHLAALGDMTHADLAQECLRLTAERLLAEGKLPLKQIAQALGFSSVHGFHRAFRRWSGLTPSDWRERQGANGNGGSAA